MFNKPVIAIEGATATGKSALAIALAKEFDGEVISVDSALVYRGMDIGTAKPTLAERDGIAHHLIDIRDPDAHYSAAEFRRDSLALIDEISARHKLPILCGGTFLYYRALFMGLAPLPSADLKLRSKYQSIVDNGGSEALHALLAKSDPIAAARLHRNDPQRIMRALEVMSTTGIGIDQHHKRQQQQRFNRPLLKIALAPGSRERHRQLLKTRFEKMLQQGFLDEARALYENPNVSADLPAMRAVAYRQAWQYFAGELDYQSMCERAIIATCQLAKRQMTWLRKEPEVHILDSQSEDCVQQAFALAAQFLGE